MKKSTIIAIIIILLSFGIAIFYYPQMPEQMASHWNVKGEVDGYMSKFWGLFLMPIVSLVIFLLFLAIPKIDPLKENIQKFRKYFDVFIVLLILFFLYIYIISILWNLGYKIDIIMLISPALGALFYYIGVMVKNAKRNWFIGIRTPWTLSSEVVWEKTHQLGGKLFKISGVLAVMGIIFKNYAVWFVLGPVIGASVYTVVYSYFEYQKQIKHESNAPR